MEEIFISTTSYLFQVCIRTYSSISSLEDKGDKMAFIDGKVVVWGKNSSIENARVIGIREGRLYKLLSPLAQALVHIEISPCELWHRRFGHLHFKILSTLNSMMNPQTERRSRRSMQGMYIG